MTEKKGLTHIYYGNSKGKTTCCVGLSVRASGAGKKVLFIQFMKTGKSNEVRALEQLPGIEVLEAPRMKKFSFNMSEEEIEEMREANDQTFAEAAEKARGGFDLFVMDEALNAIQKRILDEGLLLAFLDGKPDGLEVVMTGRHPDDPLLERADYVTEFRKVKHPYDKGILARKGIEF